VIEVSHTSSLEASESWHHWTTRVALSIHRLWPSLELLNLFRWHISNDNSGVVVGVLICLQSNFCLFSLFFFLPSPYPFNMWREKKKR
jgi:hypothetical protein